MASESARLKSEVTWRPDLDDRSCTVARVQSIAFTPMSTRLRNELITRAYYDLAVKMAELCGPDATWTTLGTWASHSIGSYLTLPIPVLGRIIARSFGHGNRDVFADLGSAQALFLEIVGEAANGSANDDEVGTNTAGLGGAATNGRASDQLSRAERVEQAFDNFRAQVARTLVPTPGPQASAGRSFWTTVGSTDQQPDGVAHNLLLIHGFAAYKGAILTDDPDSRSKLLLLGNCLLALHEQRRLSLAISMGFRSWLRNITRFWWLAGTQRKWLNKPPGQWRLNLENRWIRFATRHFVRVQMPWGRVPVGKAVPPGENPIKLDPPNDREHDGFTLAGGETIGSPDVAGQIRRTVPLDELDVDEFLHELFQEFDVNGRPATCWNSLHDRMSYIFALFAEHQRSSEWWEDDGEDGRRLRQPPRWRPFERKLRTRVFRLLPVDQDDDGDDGDPKAALALVADNALISRSSDNVQSDADSSDDVLSDADLAWLRTQPSYPVVANDSGVAQAHLHDRFDAGSTTDTGQLVLDDVKRRLATIRKNGGLLDDKTVAAARRVYAENKTLIYTALFLRSLPDAYAAARGVQVIGEVSALASDPMRRASETAQFVADLLSRSRSIDDQKLVVESIAGVRNMHAVAAFHLEATGWESDLYGVPINQEDVLATALSFSVPVFEMFEVLDLRIDDADRDAYVRFWLGIGHLLGAPLTPVRDYASGRRLAQQIRSRHHTRSLNGVRLCEGLLDGIAAGFLRGTSWMANGLAHTIGDPDVMKILSVGEGRGRRRVEVVAGILRAGLGNPVTSRPTRAVVNFIGQRTLQPFFEIGSSRPFRRRVEEGGGEGKQGPVAVIDARCWPTGCGGWDPRSGAEVNALVSRLGGD